MGKVLASLLACFAVPVMAQCECDWRGPFSWLVEDADALLLGEVVAHSGNSMDIEVLRVMKGKEVRQRVRIWGERGDLCRANVDDFAAGGQWLFALQGIDAVPPGGFNPETPNVSYGRVGDYALSKCGAYWLRHEDGKLSGNITSVFRWDYEPAMNPVPVELIQAFVDGEADYADIIGESEEITSKEAWMRHMRERMDAP